jgi:hypothetical protein
MLRCLALVAVLGLPAFADEGDPHRIALAVNFPVSWIPSSGLHGSAIGISGWVGLTEHQAIRANLAAYGPSFHNPVVAVATGAAENECPPRGMVYDAGAAWVYFPRALYSGMSLEVGVLRRSSTQSITLCDLDTYPERDRSSVTYAARAMIGWSWTIGDHAFIATAVGESLGSERGMETRVDQESMSETVRVAAWPASFETYLRFGAAI